MKKLFKLFARQDSGAVTTEFVVLVAASTRLGSVAYSGVGGGADEVTNVDPDASLQRFVSGF